MDQYPAINFLLRYGDAFAIAVALLPALAGISLALYMLNWLVLAAGLVGSLVLGVIMKSYIELVRVIADMLMPK
jgi:hypothetical protein